MSENPKLDRQLLRDAARNAMRNAGELIEEATFLYRKKRWARALFLSQIASEEVGKIPFLISATMEIAVGVMNWKDFWIRYRSHGEKMLYIALIETLALSKEYPLTELETLKETVKGYNQGKVYALYSDVVGGVALAPSDAINLQMAKAALKMANGRLRLIKNLFGEIVTNDQSWELSDEELLRRYRRLPAPAIAVAESWRLPSEKDGR